MSTSRIGHAACLVTNRASGEAFRLGLEAIEGFTGRLIDRPNADYEGEGIAFLPGDVLFGKLRPYLAKAWVADRPGAAVGDFHVYRPLPTLASAYFGYVLLSRAFLDTVEASVVGAKMPRTSWDMVRNVEIHLPPLLEQRAIADSLDRETAKIDALIEKQERLIETLCERRAAVIARAVTKGLSPNIALQPSGLRWAGEVPHHWRVGNIRRFSQMRTGHTPSRSIAAYWEKCDVPWFTLADVWQMRDRKLTYVSAETQTAISLLGLANSSAELLPAETVMLSRTASVGFAGIMPIAMATSQDYWNWVCGPEIMPRYLLATFHAMSREFQALTMGSTHKTIYQPIAAAISIVVPPLDEQRAIVAYLDEQTAKIDTLIAKAEQSIALAKERRSALITAAVTGQIDVRDQVA